MRGLFLLLILPQDFLFVKWRKYVVKTGQLILGTFQPKMTVTWAVDYFFNDRARKLYLAKRTACCFHLHSGPHLLFPRRCTGYKDRRNGFLVIIGLDHRYWTCLMEEENDVRVYFEAHTIFCVAFKFLS